MECLKKGKFSWSNPQTQSFMFLKDRLFNTPVLALPNFTQPFEAAVDACGYGIGAVWSQHTHPIEYFGDKARQKRSTYEQELYSLVRAFKVWEHYL